MLVAPPGYKSIYANILDHLRRLAIHYLVTKFAEIRSAASTLGL